MFKNLKIGPKLIIGFVAVALLVGGIGYYSVNHIYKIQKNLEVVNKLKVLTFSVIQTQDLEEYNDLKKQVDDIREILVSTKGTSQKIKDFILISNEIIEIQKEKLEQDKFFTEQYLSEKEKRHALMDDIYPVNDAQLNKILGSMIYYSKEALYQYREQTYIDEWFNKIQALKTEVTRSPALTSEKRSSLLKSLNEYYPIAQTMGKITLRGKEIETETIVKYKTLQESVSRVISESADVVTNTRNITFGSIFFGILFALVIGFSIARSISRSVIAAKNAAVEIARGNMDVQIDTSGKDEIGELSQAIDKMRVSLKAVMEEYEKRAK